MTESEVSSIFSFGDYLAALALLLVAWSAAGFRYRFREEVAGVPVRFVSFVVLGAVGVLTLANDLWRSLDLPLPSWGFVHPHLWEGGLALVALSAFLAWAWVALLRPAQFSARNASRFYHGVYRAVLRGSREELEIVAEEINTTVESIFKFAGMPASSTEREDAARVAGASEYARGVIAHLADPALCQAVVTAAPGVILEVARLMQSTHGRVVDTSDFLCQMTRVSIATRNSFAYREQSELISGPLARHQPLTTSVYGSVAVLRAAPEMLEVDYFACRRWHGAEWKAYFRLAVLATTTHIKSDLGHGSRLMYHAGRAVEFAVRETYKLADVPWSDWDELHNARLREATSFVKALLRAVGELKVASPRNYQGAATFVSHDLETIAEMMMVLIDAASSVKAPWDHAWWVQHNTVFSELFGIAHDCRAPHVRLIHKAFVRRLLRDLENLRVFGHYGVASRLSMLLRIWTIIGTSRVGNTGDTLIMRVVERWTKQYFAAIASRDQELALACLPEGLVFDREQSLLVFHHPRDRDKAPARSMILSPERSHRPADDVGGA